MRAASLQRGEGNSKTAILSPEVLSGVGFSPKFSPWPRKKINSNKERPKFASRKAVVEICQESKAAPNRIEEFRPSVCAFPGCFRGERE